MIIGVNALTITPGYGGAEEVFLRNALSKIEELKSDAQLLVFTNPSNHEFFDGFRRQCLEVPEGSSNVEKYLNEALDKGLANVLYTSVETAPAKSPVPVVLYSLGLREYEALNAQGGWRNASRLKAVRKVLSAACAITAPSEFVRKSFLDIFEIPLDKVVVAPFGVDEVFAKPQSAMVEKPYVLAVGDTYEHKNYARLRGALQRVKDELPYTLVVVGRPREAEPQEWGQRVARVDRLPVGHLAGLYQHCEVFVCPALYDGKAATVLEAMKAGARICASHVGAIPEIAADIPTYFDPQSTSSIADAILRCSKDEEEARANRIKSGKQFASEFTWERCAKKILLAVKRAQ